jgi:predicted HTH domain antitoxin
MAEIGEIMDSVTYQVKVPVSLSKLGATQKEIQRRINEWLVLSYFTEAKISSGKAARLLGISRWDFLDLLCARGISYVNFSEEELEGEIAAAKTINAKKS